MKLIFSFLILFASNSFAQTEANQTSEKTASSSSESHIFIEAAFQNSGGLVTGATIGWEAFRYFHMGTRAYVPISATNTSIPHRFELLARIPFLLKDKGHLYVEGSAGIALKDNIQFASYGSAMGFQLSMSSDYFIGGQAGFHTESQYSLEGLYRPKMDFNIGLVF